MGVRYILNGVGRIDYNIYSFCPRCPGKKEKGAYCPDCGQHLRNHPRGTKSRNKLEHKRY